MVITSKDKKYWLLIHNEKMNRTAQKRISIIIPVKRSSSNFAKLHNTPLYASKYVSVAFIYKFDEISNTFFILRNKNLSQYIIKKKIEN